MTDIKSQTQVGNPLQVSYKTSKHRYMILKLKEIKDKEKNLKKARGNKYHTYEGTRIRITSHFFSETMEVRKNKRKNNQPRILYSAELFFKSEGEVKTFLDPQKLREFISSTSISLARNIERSFSGRRIMIWVRNLDLHKERKRFFILSGL